MFLSTVICRPVIKLPKASAELVEKAGDEALAEKAE